MELRPNCWTKAICESLIESPLLVNDLPEAGSFPRASLKLPTREGSLNFEQKLGHLYEQALAALLESSPRFDLVARNIQIQIDVHQTVGELDFLVRDFLTDQFVHLELATKFYLAIESEAGLLLPGPDARDNYFRKLHRLRTHQMQLTQRHQAHFPEPYNKPFILTQQLIFGCLFNHIHASRPARPEFSNPKGRHGYWLRVDEIHRHFTDEMKFEVIPKQLWPVPLEMIKEVSLDQWEPDSTLDRCVMVRASGLSDPYFIAPNSFPDHGS